MMGMTHPHERANLSRFRVSRESPCPICGKPDWCLSDRVSWAACQRIESDRRWGSAGWFHPLSQPAIAVENKWRHSRTQVSSTGNRHPWKPAGYPAAVYYYNTWDGAPLYRKVRYYIDGKKITPFQRYHAEPDAWIGGDGCMEGVPRVLYRNEHISSYKRVFCVEGEKCADLLWEFGLLAVCNDDGAGGWRAEYSTALAGKDVVILPDADERGRIHAFEVARSLKGLANSIRNVELPGLGPKDDVYDWILNDRRNVL